MDGHWFSAPVTRADYEIIGAKVQAAIDRKFLEACESQQVACTVLYRMLPGFQVLQPRLGGRIIGTDPQNFRELRDGLTRLTLF